eukprot:scaffold229971_cov15-Tisochrysis_lutea.AAC.1
MRMAGRTHMLAQGGKAQQCLPGTPKVVKIYNTSSSTAQHSSSLTLVVTTHLEMHHFSSLYICSQRQDSTINAAERQRLTRIDSMHWLTCVHEAGLGITSAHAKVYQLNANIADIR